MVICGVDIRAIHFVRPKHKPSKASANLSDTSAPTTDVYIKIHILTVPSAHLIAHMHIIQIQDKTCN